MMLRRSHSSLLVGLVLSTFATADEIDYVRDVKPLLERCHSCHGALRQQSGLRLDTAAAMRQGGDSGAAIIPGKADESLLVHAIAGGDEVSQMPPEGEGAPLSKEAIATIKAWINQGAIAPSETPPAGPADHWAFRPVVRPPLPTVEDAIWCRNPVDTFVRVEQERRGLAHAPEATKEVLLRRVYLDLIGLPPTRDELHAFLTDAAPDAYEKVVARLLESPAYGERWGRHWMDVWRYSDWAGYRAEIRESQYHIWRWRDWIVGSLNADKPYDQMAREMIAGDEIAPTDPDVLRATGYLGRNWFRYNRNVWLDNTVEHAGKAFLGMTFNCARCHDHKYDPVAQDEYFQLRAIFEPYDVRYDRIPGEADVTKAGIARVFDKRLSDPTYVFLRGNEQTPDKDRPQSPRTPEFLSLAYQPAPVKLPVEAFYPALTGFQLEEARAALKQEVSAAEEALRQAGATAAIASQDPVAVPAPSETATAQTVAAQTAAIPTEATEPLVPTAQGLAAKKHAAAVAALESFEKRLAAERVKYGLAKDGDLKELAQAASQTQRQAALLSAELTLLESELAVSQMKRAEGKEDPKKQKALADSEAKVSAAKKALDAARTAASQASDQYEPLGEIYPETSTGRRLAFARWLTDPANPLPARVAMNHVWLRHFGQPLVPTVFDFGLNGRPPSHPELLDWLAAEFVAGGWQMKPIHRLLVLSATYRQSSSVGDFPAPPSKELAEDTDNQWLWRMPSRRLEAETVRDTLLSVAGSLDNRMGGKEQDQLKGQVIPRRSLYFRHAKEKEMLFTKLFDGPGVSECYRRDESIVPQQALALANSPLSKNQARLLARQLSDRYSADDDFIQAAFEQVLVRRPSDDEQAACREFLQTQQSRLADPSRLTSTTVGESGTIAPATEPSQRARENLIHVLFNHHDFVTVR